MDIEQVIAQSRTIIHNGGCEILVVSLGAEGALLITKHTSVQFIPPQVERKSTVGAGDSMVAGIVYFLQKNQPIKEAVQYGVACGTAATMNAGTELCRLKDVKELYSRVRLADY
jgi:6-phosphofructokinase 2